MEELITLLIPAVLTVSLVRFLMLPVRFVWKAAVHSACGFVCLWLLNAAAPYTGIAFPMNAVTVLTAGMLGLPGIGGLALLAVL